MSSCPPKVPPLLTKLPCPKCDSPLNMRDSRRGYWLSCSAYPKCRGRGKWTELEEKQEKQLTAEWKKHAKLHPLPVIRTTEGAPIGEDYLPQILDDRPEPLIRTTTPAPDSDAA